MNPSHLPVVLIASLLVGCANRTIILSENAINEPLFHKTPYTALGVTEEIATYTELDHRAPVSRFQLDANAQFPVNEWASFNFLPISWNFLLSGEQYDDSLRLRQAKLHLMLRAGLDGIGYSTVDGWTLPASIELQDKYVFDDLFFSSGILGVWWRDIPGGSTWNWGGTVGLGMQATRTFSVRLSETVLQYFVKSGYHAIKHEIVYLDGDIENSHALFFDWYPTPSNIITLSATFQTREWNTQAHRNWIFGVGYKYAFAGRQ